VIVVYMNRLYVVVIALVMMLGVGVSGLHEQIVLSHS